MEDEILSCLAEVPGGSPTVDLHQARRALQDGGYSKEAINDAVRAVTASLDVGWECIVLW